MKVTIEGSPNELKSFFNSSMNAEVIWRYVGDKKEAVSIDGVIYRRADK